MLEIQEKLTEGGYEDVHKWAGDVDLHITEALDRGEVCGYIAYSYERSKTVVYAYDDGGQLMLCDGLVRSVMLKSTIKGINTVEFRLADSEGLTALRKLRFISSDEIISENIERFMNGCSECKRSS